VSREAHPEPAWHMPAAASARRLDILAMGSFLAEEVVHVERHPGSGGQGSIPVRARASGTGGGAANVAAIAAGLGGRTALLSATGDGPRARVLLERMAAAGVGTGSVVIRRGRDADLLILLCDPAGDWVALEQLDPALPLLAEDLGPGIPFADARWLHVDGYAHHSAGSQEAVDLAVAMARAAGCLVSVDAAVPSSHADPAYLRSLFGRADVVFANRAEAAAITGAASDDEAVDAMLALGPQVAVLKRGAEGSLVATRDGRAALTAIPTEVVDTLAAGDAYVAAMLLALAQDRSLLEAATRGGAAGALACRSAGSQGATFTAADVDALLGGDGAAAGRATVAAAEPAQATRRAQGRRRPLDGLDGPVPSYVLVPGSERRAARLAERFTDAVTLAHEREFLCIAGLLDGVPVAACSTGIGGYGVSLVIDALGARGASTFLRIGVTGALPATIATGDLVVATAAVRMDGTSDLHVDPAYPAVADHGVTAALVAAAQATGAPVHVGIGATASSFYAGEGIPAFRGFRSAAMAGIEDEMRDAGALDWDTETATLFTVARLRGWRAGRVNVVVDNPATGRYDPAGEPRAIDTALEAIRILARWDAAGLTWRRPGGPA
jgi:uridine phosphorylase